MIDWKQAREWNDFIWYWYSNIAMLVPMTILFFYKLWNPINYALLRKPDWKVRSGFGDKFLTNVASYSLFYYFIDCFIKIASGHYTDKCDIVMLLHHTFSIIYLPSIIFPRHWTWFALGPAMIHTYLLAFPDAKWLNYIYILIIFCFHYGLYQEPFTNLKEFNRMKRGIVCIEVVCFFFWLFDCNNCLVNCDVGLEPLAI